MKKVVKSSSLLNQSCNFDVLLDLESLEQKLPTLFMKKDKFCEKHKDGYGDSMTDPAQRAESVKIKCLGRNFRGSSALGKILISRAVALSLIMDKKHH